MTIHLPKDVEQSIAAAVDSGHFTSFDDAEVAGSVHDGRTSS